MSVFDNCLYFSTNQLARNLNTIADKAFKGSDYTATQGFTLIAIGELDKHTPSEIAEVLGMRPSTITRFLDKLVDYGYVERAYLGRNTEVNLTSKGYKELPEVQKQWKEIDKIIGEKFTEKLACQLNPLIHDANELYINKNK
jgi:DNA-binding MarR family transcriptional regulator